MQSASDATAWDDLVDRVRLFDIHYLGGGSTWDGRPSRYGAAADVSIRDLIADLVHAPHPRLRDALVALLFRHPEYVYHARAIGAELPLTAPDRLLLLASYLAAAALQRAWKFTYDIYLPGRHYINGDDLALELGVPSPDEDYGRACLQALSDLLARRQPFPFDYRRAWEDAVEHVIDDLRLHQPDYRRRPV